ncbi:hypothetical protein [Flammeovirga aprica]|uniref:Uncharacterized protein n=1 Tax=Flammeovirga aprica JL-4 TaxID=694437 RepID=A0A7X9RUW3_9BACT|nr:hypothetical protein [Flammeovirga aprica]NME69168.1 hypothetical protein [Flammeovirga aprica JL-4]
MILANKGFQIDNFLIPPFELHEGEIIRLCLYGGSHFFEFEDQLVKILTGLNPHPDVTIHQKMVFAEPIWPHGFKEFIYPLTIKRYLRQHAKFEDLKIFSGLDDVKPNTKIITLPGNQRKWISIASKLSYNKNIIFDLVGQDPLGAMKTLEVMKSLSEKGYSALFLDNFDDPEVSFDKEYYIEKI